MTELAITVFAASLLGSLHCVGMCGGFVAFYSADVSLGRARNSAWRAHAAYSLGRLAAYVLIGVAAGAFGAAFNLAGRASGIAHLSAVVSGTLIIGWGGLRLAQQSGARGLHAAAPRWFNAGLGRVLARARRWPSSARAGVLGVSSALLPCGWLYGFAVSAVGAASVGRGAVVMTAFWLGTVPALLGVGFGMRRFARWFGPHLGWLMPAMLIVLGVLTIAQRSGFGLDAGLWSVEPAASSGHRCHP